MTKSDGVRIEVKGLRELTRDLRRAGDRDTIRAIRLANKEGAEVVARQSKVEAPKLTGTLAASVRPSGTQRYGQVLAGKAAVPYAGPIHFGWPARSIAPQPFIYEAADKRADEVFDLYADRIDAVLSGVKGDG